MKILSRIVLLIVAVAVFESCKKDDPQPTAYESQAKLLAGDKGQTKTWKLVSQTQQSNGGAITTATLPTCFADNNYIFSNNDKQDYSSNEGVSKCDATDPTITESGTWSFTADGKMVIVLTNTYTTQSPNSPAGLYIRFPFPAVVNTLTDTSMVTKMTIVEDGISYLITFTFAKV